MIDIDREELLSLNEACKVLPRRNGKRPHFSTVLRWCKTPNRHGIKLEWIKLRGTIYTSKQALQRYAERCTAADAGLPFESPSSTLTASQLRRAEAAERELEKAGI